MVTLRSGRTVAPVLGGLRAGVLHKAGPIGREGVSVVDFEQTGGTGAPGTLDTYEFTLSDGTTFPFAVRNGDDGEPGGVPAGRKITTPNGGLLTGGGDLSADRTLAVDTVVLDERIRDTVAAALQQGTGITITKDDPGDAITIAANGGSTAPGAMLAMKHIDPSSDPAISTTSTTPVALGAPYEITFTPTTAGSLMILDGVEESAAQQGARAFWSLKRNGADVAASGRLVAWSVNAYALYPRARVGIYLSGLAIGQPHTLQWAHRSASSSQTVRFRSGRVNEHSGSFDFGPSLMEVYAAL